MQYRKPATRGLWLLWRVGESQPGHICDGISDSNLDR